MKKALIFAGVVALSAAVGSFDASAQGRGGGHGGGMGGGAAMGGGPGMGGTVGSPPPRGGELRGLDRADQVAGARGAQGRAIARTRGANKPGFCPPGQRKKPGAGSRFAC